MPPAPKPAAQRQRRNRVPSAATIEAPPATKVALGTWMKFKPIHPMTKRTWDVWWASPIAAEWVDADVPDLVALAMLVDAFWTAEVTDRPKIHSEIRMATREFGLTPMSRRSLQWEIKRLEEAKPKAASSQPRRRNGRAVLSVLGGGA